MKNTVFFLILTFSLTSCAFGHSHKLPKWYRGNTHVHTVLCGHADSSPEVVTKWYHDNDYNFLILSEHNIFIDPKDVKMPEDRRKDFILIPGEEVTGARHIHSTAMNVKALVDWKFKDKDKSKMMQRQVDDIEKANGVTILNHPDWRNALTDADIFKVDRLYMFELFNMAWEGNNEYHNKKKSVVRPRVDELWDLMLSRGMVIYGVAADDAHKFELKNLAFKSSNPGRAWVMVRANSLNAEDITAAMYHGDFYASSGVFLKDYQVSKNKITVEVSDIATQKELAKTHIKREGRIIKKGKSGYLIELIGQDGKVLKSKEGLKASFSYDKTSPYYRVRISYQRPHKVYGHEGYYAWCMPVFTDGRVKKLQKFTHEYLKTHEALDASHRH
jgi:predicted metal-dependent phosphoesterase TrpH